MIEDSVWHWSSAPDRYFDTALHLEASSNPDVHLVDTSRAPTLSATLLVCELESSGETRLVGAVEFQTIGTDRALHTKVVRASKLVWGELSGNLAAAAGRLFHRLAMEGLTWAASTKP